MYYMFIKMSGKWYYQEFASLKSKTLRENMIEHVNNGNVVAFADDLEEFSEEMNVEIEDMEFVKPEEPEDTE